MPYVRKSKRRPSVSRRMKIAAATFLGLAALLVVSAMFLMQQERLARGAAEAAQFTPAPLQTATETPTLAVIGDSYSAGANNDTVWPEIIAPNHRVANLAVGGTGYSAGSSTFAEQAGEIPDGADVILISGSRNDMHNPSAAGEAARELLPVLKASHPEAKIVVIGPMWDNSAPADAAIEANMLIREASEFAGLPFVDALAGNWLGDPALIQGDGIHPTDEGQQVLAERISAALAPLEVLAGE